MWTIDEELAALRRKLTVVRLVTGTVEGGVVVPDVTLPEGTRVTVSLEEARVGRRARNEQLFYQLAQCDLP